MNREQAREKHKEMFWKYPSSKMKDETLYKKIWVVQELVEANPWEENIVVSKETAEALWVTTITNVYEDKLPSKDWVKPEKMTTKMYNTYKAKWLI